MAWNKRKIEEYIKESRSLVLATADEDGMPQLRAIGGYGTDGLQIYFGTAKTSGKVRQIGHQPHVALLFQHEAQQTPKNITVYGTAELLEGEEFKKGVEIIRERRPQLSFQREESNIYRIRADTIKILDFEAETKLQVIRAEDAE